MAHHTGSLTLTPAQVQAYHTAGYLHLPGVFGPDEVAAWHAECDRLLASDLVDEDNLRTRFRSLADGTRIVEKFDPVTDASPVFAALAADPRIVGPVTQLFDAPALLFKDKVIFKPAGAAGYSPHQDFTWWQPFPSQKLLSVMVAVDGASAANGAIEFIAGRHHQHYIPTGETRGLSAEELERFGLTAWEMLETSPGDILIFGCLTPHRSGTNTSDQSRRQFYPSYIAAEGVGPGIWEMHYEHYRWYVEQGLSAEAQARLVLR